MSYSFLPDHMYRMPTHFGPRTGPRFGPDGRKFDGKNSPKSTSVSVSFLSNADQLSNLLPPGFELSGESVVTVSATYMKEIEWLAGRGYNTLGVSFAATYNGEQEQATGSFLSVLWENLTDPIITGREELGFSKIYCELPEPTTYQGTTHCMASWLGFKFMDLHVGDLTQLSQAEIAAATSKPSGAGTLHYKYMPRTGEWGTADIAYAVLTPAETPNRVVHEIGRGSGSVRFYRARWEDMPTQYNIVNAIHDLEIQEYRGGTITKSVGGKDLSDQRILK